MKILRFGTFCTIISKYIDFVTTAGAMFYVTLPQLTKQNENFLLPPHMKSASENTPFGGPFGGLDDHYPLISKGNIKKENKGHKG